MKHLSCLHRTLSLAVLTALLLSAALPASARFILGGGDEIAAVTAFSKSSLSGQAISFSAGDFQVEGRETLDAIVVESLPDPGAGILTLGDTPLAVGDIVSMHAVDGLCFRFLEEGAAQSASFTFVPQFRSGVSGGAVTVGLHLLTAQNTAPTAEDLSLSTYKNVAITERFAAADPEGDLLTFRLVDKPARGAVTLPEDGSNTFVYTPYENKTGKDSFTYVAVDAVGNTSEPATVKIKIEKTAGKVTYADMDGNPAHKAAVRLAEEGVFVGARVGGRYFFQPEAAVTRSQFVAMAMDMAQVELLEDVTRTGFADDGAIAAWAKPYVSSALRAGLVQGSLGEDGQVVFAPDAPITRAEAAVLLDRTLQVADVSEPTLYALGAAAPVWAVQSAANLESCGLLDGGDGLADALTRAEAAQLLCGALEVLDSRDTGGLFSW